MKTVPFLIKNTRSWSKTHLLGLAIGGYVAISAALFCFGGALTSSSFPRPGNLQAFLFLIPGVFVGFLDFIQIHAADYFGYVPRERLTKSALWLNVIPILGFFAMLLLKDLIPTGGHLGFLPLAVALLTATSFVLGILLSLVNVFWILIVAKARVALLATVCLCVLPALWPAYRMGIFTPDAGRYATRDNATIYLHPTDVNFEIPRAWLEWNAEFHNNLHLTHRELQSVRFGAGEWDHESAKSLTLRCPLSIAQPIWAGRDGAVKVSVSQICR